MDSEAANYHVDFFCCEIARANPVKNTIILIHHFSPFAMVEITSTKAWDLENAVALPTSSALAAVAISKITGERRTFGFSVYAAAHSLNFFFGKDAGLDTGKDSVVLIHHSFSFQLRTLN